MAYGRGKIEGGHKRGHSNMTHREYTAEVKARTRHQRRRADQAEAGEQLSAMAGDPFDSWFPDLWSADSDDSTWFDWADWKYPE